jgi:hypothetical protein
MYAENLIYFSVSLACCDYFKVEGALQQQQQQLKLLLN